MRREALEGGLCAAMHSTSLYCNEVTAHCKLHTAHCKGHCTAMLCLDCSVHWMQRTAASEPPLYRLHCPLAPFLQPLIIEASFLTISHASRFALHSLFVMTTTRNACHFKVYFLHNSVVLGMPLQIDEDLSDSLYRRIYSCIDCSDFFEARGLNALPA